MIRDTLDVEVEKGTIANSPLVGAVAVATNRGLAAHPMASEEELIFLRELFKVPVDVSTVNCGSPYLRIGVVANSHGAVVGSETTGPEMARLEVALGFVEVAT